MKRTALLLSALATCLTPITLSQKPSLEPLKPIGVGWNTDNWAWMSFVAFNDKGNEVASDGATTPKDVSGELSFWTFPEGRFLRKLPVKPTAISDDFKYYASHNAVGDLTNGRKLFSLSEDTYATFAFSHDNRYVAESMWRNAPKGAKIRVLELPTLKQVSAFSRSSAQSMAISPDGVTLASGHWDAVVLWNIRCGPSCLKNGDSGKVPTRGAIPGTLLETEHCRHYAGLLQGVGHPPRSENALKMAR
jgi:hypothetical protein